MQSNAVAPLAPPARARIRLRIVLADGVALGPGKADLLAAISELGSIAAAGRSMNMSYQRAWSLIEALNTMFREPLVSVSRGGARRGGAKLTEMGHVVLGHYRAIEAATAVQSDRELVELAAMAKQQEPDIATHR